MARRTCASSGHPQETDIDSQGGDRVPALPTVRQASRGAGGIKGVGAGERAPAVHLRLVQASSSFSETRALPACQTCATLCDHCGVSWMETGAVRHQPTVPGGGTGAGRWALGFVRLRAHEGR